MELPAYQVGNSDNKWWTPKGELPKRGDNGSIVNTLRKQTRWLTAVQKTHQGNIEAQSPIF